MIQAMGPGSSSMQVMGLTSPVVAPSNPSQMPGSPGQGQQGGGRKGQGAGEPAFTNYRDIFNGAIDYIFVRCVGGRKIEVRACLGMIGEAEASREGGGYRALDTLQTTYLSPLTSGSSDEMPRLSCTGSGIVL